MLEKVIAWLTEPSSIGAIGALLAIGGYSVDLINAAVALIVAAAGFAGQLLARERG